MAWFHKLFSYYIFINHVRCTYLNYYRERICVDTVIRKGEGAVDSIYDLFTLLLINDMFVKNTIVGIIMTNTIMGKHVTFFCIDKYVCLH